ncbi:MAG TPA: DUF4198 domain-containing protein [Gemmatimonadaceae bacterium]|nr:DUF4198 domain-containing protein [Gemmatimonadaceae bacterium]
MFTNRSRSARTLLAAGGVLFATSQLLAHDFWLEPSSFRLEPGAAVELRLRVGEHFVGDALPRHPAMLAQFIAAGPLRIEQPGLVVVGYRSRHSRVEQTPDAFDAYLAEEGLDRILAVRAARKPTAGTIPELFSRCAKTLLLTGPADPSSRDRALGFTLELVSDRNPYTMRPGDDLPLRLLYEGRPLEGALVVAMNKQDPAAKLRARSNRDGRVSLRLPRDGAWLVKAVHMIPWSSSADAEWESFWASLTFELPRASSSPR